jgi:hypothetical protein
MMEAKWNGYTTLIAFVEGLLIGLAIGEPSAGYPDYSLY